MWEFIRNGVLIYIGLFFLIGLVVLLFERTALGLVVVAFLMAGVLTFFRLNQPPTDDELEKARKLYEGMSMGEAMRAINRKMFKQVAIGVLIVMSLIVALVIYALHRQPIE